MIFRALPLALALLPAACADDTALIVDVLNPQGLAVAVENVTVTLTAPDGAVTTRSHQFAVNGNLGTFSVRFPSATRGSGIVQVEPRDASGAPTGRGTIPLTLDGRALAKMSLTLERRLNGTSGGLLAGALGGLGTRDGDSGTGSLQKARLDHPIAFAVLDGFGYVLERCQLRRVRPLASGGGQFDTLVPCGAGTPAGAGTLADLVLVQPAALVADPTSHRLFISDGVRLLAVSIPAAMQAAPREQLAYVDFAQASGVAPTRAVGLALWPYRDSVKSQGPYTDLYVADSDSNLIWDYPLAGGAPTVVAGDPAARGQPCVSPLPAAETKAAGSPVVATQAHLCAPTKIDTGARALDPSQSVLFIADTGHAALRTFDPGLGVTTDEENVSGVTAIGYRLIDHPAGTPLVGGALLVAYDDKLGLYVTYSSTNAPPLVPGTFSTYAGDGKPGYTEELDLLAGSASNVVVRFDDVEQIFRPLTEDTRLPIIGNTFLAVVQSGNGVVQEVSGTFHLSPLFGLGPHPGADQASSSGIPTPAFRTPAGLAWGGAGKLFVADAGNHAVAEVSYDASQLPLVGQSVTLAAGCPGSPGDLDGPAGMSRLRGPSALAFDPTGPDLYLADGGNATVRRIRFSADGAPPEIHALDGVDGTTSADCDGGLQDAGQPAPGALGVPAALAFDGARRILWVARADAPALIAIAVDGTSATPVPLPPASGPAVGLALIGARLFAVDAAGVPSQVALDAATPVASAGPALALPAGAQVTAFGTDGEWLYLADDTPQLWRVDPWAATLALEAAPLAGDGRRGVELQDTPPGLNRIGGLAYDPLRGALFLSDSIENAVMILQ